MTQASWLIGILCAGSLMAAEPTIDGTSAPMWKPCTGWVKNHPVRYGVTNEKGALVFSAEGAGTEMPWLVDLKHFTVTGNERYLVVRYRAAGMSTDPNVYFLHGEEGSLGGQNYAKADSLVVDGQWHTLALDLAAIEPLESTHHLAVKVLVAGGPGAKLTIESIRFVDRLPESTPIAPVPPRPPLQSVAIDWGQVGTPPHLTAMPGWTQSPAADFTTRLDGRAVTFTVRGRGKCMRWLLALPQPIDLGRLRHMAVRYKASGQLASTTYAVWLGGKRSGAAQQACVPLLAGDLQADGAWHNLSLTPSETFAASELAIGLDCAGNEASMTLDTIHFSSRPRRWSLAQVLDYKSLDQPWPAGQGGCVAAPAAVTGGRPSAFLAQRLDVADWFKSENILVGDVPFVVQRDAGRIPQSPMGEFGALSLDLPAGVREIYLLTAAAAPPTEPWGIEWRNPRPQEVLDVPEKAFYEIRYQTGPPDRVLPLDAATGRWGMKRGLSVNVVHPDPARRATALVLHDRMQTASFAILGATMSTAAPRIVEPNWNHLHAGIAPARISAVLPTAQRTQATEATVAAGALEAQFGTQEGLTWLQLGIPGAPEQLACAPGPVFRVTVADRVLADRDWTCEKTEQLGEGRRFFLRHRAAGLAATVDCAPGEGNQLLLRMTLANESKTATTATLHFPLLGGLRIGMAADTWYVCGKRGGIINVANAAFREPLGERHPLQMDGFFNPQTGLALACLTHDTVAQHHFVNLAKTDRGGEWSVEYVARDLAPGAAFATTEAAWVLRSGDWRAIFAAYTEWLGMWFKPVAPRKPWFEKSFAMASGSGYYDDASTPQRRGCIQPQVDTMLKHIGRCDYLHLFGWGASKTHGDWGDYDHYDELGGLEYFRKNLQAVQRQGIAVSLYLDGYLNCAQGQSVGVHAEAWAMRRPDGSPQYVDEYKAYNECPSLNAWQDYLSGTYRRVRDELGPQVLYVDEYGATDGRWLCRAKDHGHNGYEIPYAGEVAMLKRIRAAVGPEMVLYTEYPPAEVSRRYLDGSITYQALWSADQEPLAPHFIDLPRFAFPDFKQLHIIYYVTNRAGNWWLLKYPFFNGEVYRIGVPNLPGMDEPSLAFLRRAVQVQCAHREAFASRDVRPLVPTEVAGVFANEFSGPKETVWTLYNANGRSVGKPVLRVRHVQGARYEDAWNGRPLVAEVKGGSATVALELDPKGIGCLVQRLPQGK